MVERILPDRALTPTEERRLVMAINRHGKTIRIKTNVHGTWITVKAADPVVKAIKEARLEANDAGFYISGISRWEEDNYTFQVTTDRPASRARAAYHKACESGHVAQVRFIAEEAQDG